MVVVLPTAVFVCIFYGKRRFSLQYGFQSNYPAKVKNTVSSKSVKNGAEDGHPCVHDRSIQNRIAE